MHRPHHPLIGLSAWLLRLAASRRREKSRLYLSHSSRFWHFF